VVSQAADELVSLSPIEGAADRVRATIRLRCGCIVELAIAEDRIVQRPDGRSFPVGKYPCPLGHPAG
jgi:hypothetical protein